MKRNFLSGAIVLGAMLSAAAPVMADSLSISGTIEEESVYEIGITNEYIVQDLVIEKTVHGEDDGTEFAITLSLSGLPAGGVVYTSEGKIIADEDGNAEETFYLAGDESVTIYDLPKGAVYQASEAACEGYVASYVLTNEGSGGSISGASGRNTAENTALSTQEETVDGGEEITITFTNTEYVLVSVLPSTGGIGRGIFILASLAGLCGIFLISKEKPKKTA